MAATSPAALQKGARTQAVRGATEGQGQRRLAPRECIGEGARPGGLCALPSNRGSLGRVESPELGVGAGSSDSPAGVQGPAGLGLWEFSSAGRSQEKQGWAPAVVRWSKRWL